MDIQEQVTLESGSLLARIIKSFGGEYRSTLKRMISELEFNTYEDLFVNLKFLLIQAYNSYSVYTLDIIKGLVNAFSKRYELDVPLHTMVYSLGEMPEGFYDYYLEECYPEEDYYDHATSLFKHDNEQEAISVYQTLDETYNVNNPEVYRCLLSTLDQYEQKMPNLNVIRSYFEMRQASTSSYQVREKSVTYIEDEPLSQKKLYDEADTIRVGLNSFAIAGLINNIAQTINGEKEERNTVLDGAVSMGLTILNNMMSDPDYEEERQTIFSTMSESSLEVSNDLFKRFGPCNPKKINFKTDVSISDDPCVIHGGCRMLTCWEHAGEEDETPTYTSEWFTGVCETCMLHIEQKHEAKRLPLGEGGWAGCYCSWDCVDKDIHDPYLKGMCNEFRTDYETIGIYDRVWEEPQVEITDQKIIDVMSSLFGRLKV